MVNKKSPIKENETGLVSLVVALIIMVILSITVIGFANLMRREQRQTLDRQLNTQAFYAAESGINDAVNAFKAIPPSDPRFHSYTDCVGPNSFVTTLGLTSSANLDGTGSVTYSCIQIDPNPTSLERTDVGWSPWVVPVVAASGNINNIVVSWQAKDGNTNFSCPGAPQIPPDLTPSGNWNCQTGLIRLDLVPTDSITRDDLNKNQRTLFLYPRSFGTPPANSPSIGPPSTTTGQIVLANCDASVSPKHCGVSIDVSGFSSGNFYLRVSSLYKNSSVTITANNGGADLKLNGGQIVVDATGKANDVLRRIQVRVPVNPLGDGPFPLGAIQSADSICKRFFVIPSTNTVDTDVGSISDPANPCAIN